jgi:signal transduction histidine kinase
LLSLQVLQRRALRHIAPSGKTADEQHAKIEVSLRDLELPLQQTGRLNRLVNDLLDTARIQSGRLALTLKLEDLVDIVRATVEEHSQAFPERSIILHLPEAPIIVSADAERISQVVANFLTNAFKYSREECPVEIGVEVEGSLARAWVRDRGPGLLPDYQAHIWERFYRVPGLEIQSGSGVGLGLGLHISKTIIEQHYGQVGVQSAPGQGSTFWFTLAVAAPADEAC